MSIRRRLLIFFGIVSLVVVVGALVAPFAVADGIRFWLWWAGREEGVVVRVEKISAPLLRPVTLEQIVVGPAQQSGHEFALRAEHVTLALNFRGWLFAKGARLLHSISVDRMRVDIKLAPNPSGSKLQLRRFNDLLPDEFDFHHFDFDYRGSAGELAFRDASLTASEVEAGTFSAAEVLVNSPILRRSFANLHGATSWESDRLTFAGISLSHGLDLQSLALDLSRLEKRRLALDFDLDTFGGTLRATLEIRGGAKPAIQAAGSASDVSLAQLSAGLGFVEPVSGRLHASKFTFRGNPGHLLDATASVWLELTSFSWRAREADNVMLGGTYYDRRFVLDQLYVRQGRNALTVSGELRWPKNPVHWRNLRFRGQLDAQLPELNRFAQLFGAQTGALAGEVAATGELNLFDPEAAGQLKITGEKVSFRGVAADSLGASLQLHGSEAKLESFDLRRGQDFIKASGTFDLSDDHRYAGRVGGSLDDLRVYAPLLPDSWQTGKIAGGITFEWSGDGTIAAHSGTFQTFAHGLQLPVPLLRSPRDITLAGSYSPEDVFFRTFRVASERMSLGGFVMLGSNFVEAQALEVAFDGRPRITGTIFVPVGLKRFAETGSLLQAFDERQKFDLDLAVDHLDIGQVSEILQETPQRRGILTGRLAAYGALADLQVTANCHVDNLGPPALPNSIDLGLYYADGFADFTGTGAFGISAPLALHASVPLRLQKRWMEDWQIIKPNAPISLTIGCPALFPETLPFILRPLSASGGFLAGWMEFSGTKEAPLSQGEVTLVDVAFHPPEPWPTLRKVNAQLTLGPSGMLIDWLRLQANDQSTAWRGKLVGSSGEFSLQLAPLDSQIAVRMLPRSGDCLSSVRMASGTLSSGEQDLRELVLRGSYRSDAFSLTIRMGRSSDSLPAQTTLFGCPNFDSGQPLVFTTAARAESIPAQQFSTAFQNLTRKPQTPSTSSILVNAHF